MSITHHTLISIIKIIHKTTKQQIAVKSFTREDYTTSTPPRVMQGSGGSVSLPITRGLLPITWRPGCFKTSNFEKKVTKLSI
ncbi:hypothetical protein Hanom_Chr03g00191211 [Helianthus anomalus]